MPAAATIAYAIEATLCLGGLAVFWRTVAGPNARWGPGRIALERWQVSPASFLIFLWAVFAGFFVPGIGALQLLTSWKVDRDVVQIVAGAASQVGMFLAFFGSRKLVPELRVPLVRPPETRPHFAKAGAAVFLIAMPVIMSASLVWQALLKLAGIAPIEQDIVGIVAGADSPAFLILTLSFAIFGAPVCEELIFRAGVFRYAFTRLPRRTAILLPAILFAAAHFNLEQPFLAQTGTFVPLVLLGAMFCIAFERTGDIRVSMVAHALFNLNSAMLVLAGATAS